MCRRALRLPSKRSAHFLAPSHLPPPASAAGPRRSLPLSLFADRCASLRQLKQVHAQMVVRDRIHDNYAASRLIAFAALLPSGDLRYALRLFHQTREPNSFMWNTVIRGLADSPRPSDAIDLYVKMQRMGVPPGKHTYPFLLKGCTNCCAFSTCRQVHTHVLKRGLDVDVYIVNGLIRCYGSGGLLSHARKLFDGAPARNLIVWTTMVSAYAQNFQADKALQLFDQMIQEGLEPNDATLSSVLSACARSGGLDLGGRIHLFMKEKGIELGVILGTALVDMYAKNGAISVARELFRAMPEKNIATWNAMICGLAHHGHASEALRLFRELEKEAVAPNDVTFVGVLSACCHAGLLEAGRGIFCSMQRDYANEPKIEHYGCMVDLLGRCGRLTEAEDLISGMKWEPDIVVLGALLTACKHHRNIEVAERVVRRILELEPHSHGVYVVLSNMYAEAGRWEDVERWRKAMRDGGLNKVPAWSCIGDDKN
ncbi:hypothetical protein Taro_013242 [Colocasia esculenta]|uniref:Pentatricopeptide repeat-containing protein n=1 Tax=Colocasia esculenta TaxID=4460 RepID=A0A843UBI7_COLES|nr:hypothetical protein [Colocasia esculenta]